MSIGQRLVSSARMIGRINEIVPGCAVSSDFIVGFCGESDQEFEASVRLVEECRFKNSFIFKYSPRSGTKADERFDDDVPEGSVVSQDPGDGAQLFQGETVTLPVSKGPDLVEVPQVRAQGVESARQELEALGFVVETREASGYLGLGYVFSQDPSAGERIPRGSTITLTLI